MNSIESAVLVIMFAGITLAGGGEIRGTVCLQEKGTDECVKPLDSVRICCYVRGETDSIIAWTDSQGKYKIPVPEPAGRKTLLLSKEGFKSAVVHDVIVSGDKTTYVYAVQLERSR